MSSRVGSFRTSYSWLCLLTPKERIEIVSEPWKHIVKNGESGRWSGYLSPNGRAAVWWGGGTLGKGRQEHKCATPQLRMSKVVLPHSMLLAHVSNARHPRQPWSAQEGIRCIYKMGTKLTPEQEATLMFINFPFPSIGPRCLFGFILSFLPSRLRPSLWSCLAILYYNFPLLTCF